MLSYHFVHDLNLLDLFDLASDQISMYFTLPPLFQQIPTEFHRTQPIPTDCLLGLSDFQRNLSDLTKFRCLSGPSPVKVR